MRRVNIHNLITRRLVKQDILLFIWRLTELAHIVKRPKKLFLREVTSYFPRYDHNRMRRGHALGSSYAPPPFCLVLTWELLVRYLLHYNIIANYNVIFIASLYSVMYASHLLWILKHCVNVNSSVPGNIITMYPTMHVPHYACTPLCM